MKKQKLKNIIKIQKYIIFTLISIIWISIAYWSFQSLQITSQQATNSWSYNSKIEIKSSSWAYYINNRNNSSIIWNYFEWYYYDSLYWIFKLNWSSDINKNVRIVSWTNKCSSWYWYNLWWKAYSKYAGYIDFSWVYYCLSDKKLHWKAYSKFIWYQSFEGIWFEIITKAQANAILETNSWFLNDSKDILNKEKIKWKQKTNSNAWSFKIWWDEFKIDDTKGSIFYIIK